MTRWVLGILTIGGALLILIILFVVIVMLGFSLAVHIFEGRP